MQDYYCFYIEALAQPLGYVHKSIVQAVTWPPYWTVDNSDRRLILLPSMAHPALKGMGDNPFDHRTNLMRDTVLGAHDRGEVQLIQKLNRELVPVRTSSSEHVLDIFSGATPMFGTVAYGVSLIAWTVTSQGQLYWLQRRAKTRTVHPGKLDTTASGSIRSREAVIDAMVREAAEEAGIDPLFSRRHLWHGGTISYHLTWNSDGSPGSIPHVLYVFEMPLPADRAPTPTDGEVSEFVPMTKDAIFRALVGDDFKPIVAAVWLCHFMRHGVVNADNECNFLELHSHIHRRHRLFDIELDS